MTDRQLPELRSARLRLRPWRERDLDAFAAINADPRVMQHMPACLSRRDSDALAKKIREHFDAWAYGLWAIEVAQDAPFIGFVGLNHPPFEAHFTPCVEVGWRLARAHWGQGYATEAAREALDFGFHRVGLEEIVSFTVPDNRASRRVMEKLGMVRDLADDFDHPKLPPGNPLRRHVLYRIRSRAPG